MMGENYLFKSQQIVYLSHKNHRLYCEVIQVVESRQLCWVRPLFLVDIAEEMDIYSQLITPKVLMDVRSTSDLLYPITLFNAALDTEVIPILTQLQIESSCEKDNKIARQKLHQFITKIWQNNPEKF
ncbi:MAG: hypothetical protein QNJ64_11685 [Crocosphaera sp.]|nr:hypothetical protein [Crocosphaera sp.]